MTDSQEAGMNEFAPLSESINVAVDETNTASQEITEKLELSRAQRRPDLSSRLRAGGASFRLWRLRRPFWGSVLMLLASLFMLAGPLTLLSSTFLPGSAVPIALLVGGLMLVMALAQLFVPAHALITGLIGIVLSIVSLITGSFGGFGIGMIIGILGSAQGVAWQANARPLPTRSKKSGRLRKAAQRKPQLKD
ncbi:MAG TPA: DUF6114 domain-containing protein [Ktedonobacteraceae bacterium]|nr:DUF6114 domain-containing protein [Ktedonobacteraceae bacterium]